jgi:hypothetical protein
MHDVLVALFIATAGLTASGIVANIYRIAVGKNHAGSGKALYLAVMVIAGPSVLFDNAARIRRKKECSNLAFGLAAAVAAYWSLAIGLVVIELVMAFARV